MELNRRSRTRTKSKPDRSLPNRYGDAKMLPTTRLKSRYPREVWDGSGIDFRRPRADPTDPILSHRNSSRTLYHPQAQAELDSCSDCVCVVRLGDHAQVSLTVRRETTEKQLKHFSLSASCKTSRYPTTGKGSTKSNPADIHRRPESISCPQSSPRDWLDEKNRWS